MTVAAAIPIYRYDGNDSATTFPFAQIFRADGDLYVVHRSTSGVNTYPVLDTDYTVTGEGTTSSGSVEFPKGGSAYPTLATGERLAILRASDKGRLTDMSETFFFNDMNTGEDNTVMMIQELQEQLSRCSKYLETNSGTPPTLEALEVTGGDGNHANLTTSSLTYALSGHTEFTGYTSGAGAPSSTPAKLGQVYIDETNDIGYMSTGTASSADWAKLTKITISAGAPSSTPAITGLINIDETNDIAYISTGTATSADWAKLSKITTSAGVPSSTPAIEGLIHIDTTGDVVYISTGIVSSADWTSVSKFTIAEAAAVKEGTAGATLDGGGSVIATGAHKIYRTVPYSGTITAVRMFADQSGSVVVDIWKDTYANFPPTVADTITAAAKPTMAPGIKYEDETLSGWTTAVTKGDVLEFNVDSVATITKLIIELDIQKGV